MKICNKCQISKDLSMFAKYRYNNILHYKVTCRECYKPSKKLYYNNNAAAIILKNSNYKKQHREQINEREKERRKNDIEYKLYSTVRSVVKASIKRNSAKKNGATLKYLPYTIEQLKQHLESLFEPWMNWNNWGKYDSKTWNDNDPTTWTWQVDHIIPQSCLPYSSMEDENFKKCWVLENLRSYSSKQNIIDGPSGVRHLKDKNG